MTQEQDVETVKRAADKQSKCTCVTPKRDSLLGRTQCIECQGVITSDMEFELVDKQAGRIAEVDKGIDAGLDAQQFAHSTLQDPSYRAPLGTTASNQLAVEKAQRSLYKEQLKLEGNNEEEIRGAMKQYDADLDARRECLCVAPDPDKLGPPAVCRNCGKRVGTQASMNLIKARAPRTTASATAVTSYVDDGKVKACHLGTDNQWHDGEADKCMSCTVDKAAAEHERCTGHNNCPVHLTDKCPEYSAVTPPHYQRGPRVALQDYDTAEYYDIQAIDVMRCIQDPRLATAFKYIWRVAFGGKQEPWDSRTPEEVDSRDISSAVWYLQDYLSNPPQRLAPGSTGAYTPGAVGPRETKG